MHRFKDNKGREWDIVINVQQIRRVRDLIKVDLYNLFDDGMRPLSSLMMDVCKLIDVIWVLIETQARGRGVTDEMLGESLSGDALQQAAESFTQELIDFFPDQKGRQAVRQTVETQKELCDLMRNQAMEELRRLDLQAEARRLMGGLPSDSSGAAPVSSASTQDHSP